MRSEHFLDFFGPCIGQSRVGRRHFLGRIGSEFRHAIVHAQHIVAFFVSAEKCLHEARISECGGAWPIVETRRNLLEESRSHKGQRAIRAREIEAPFGFQEIAAQSRGVEA